MGAGHYSFLGLKKLTSIPLVTRLHTAPVTTKTLSTIPRTPKNQLSNHIALYFWGRRRRIHMKLG
uniref:Uncharacterized protein n=1 Tax=Cannabis sativa TaxID=3483 RepID=A0A803QVN6_CANSA